MARPPTPALPCGGRDSAPAPAPSAIGRVPISAATVVIPPDWNALVREDPARAQEELLRVCGEFQSALASGLVCSGFERDAVRPRYLFDREP